MSEQSNEPIISSQNQAPDTRKTQDEIEKALEEARLKKFEEDKARKEKDKGSCSRWAPGAWDAARADFAAGKIPPEPWFPIIINDYMTPEKIREICGLPSPPTIEWTTTAPFETDYTSTTKRVQYCTVHGWEASCLIREASHGESVLVWFKDERRSAWQAAAEALESEDER
ncbi:hypothetical protein P170DRAFT_473345 [Aspergillus steynii IBT 23096]|uniref:Uncharacterized protein n=1 Tax=Aspergillus steynii IBT 23096 TaxID=1392250 RepID=A0A2I2GKT3_9EURO|nr:uncharacterized protein P170DRAFT_473345 [Aspergillus steynii IBT 23096]PLB53485.1 hypothetical protein P170DRAFT_473345 [Aspergillus steynii IBT 23096]